jgi:hypothetical protein
MHVAFSSVNCGLNSKPSFLKNSMVLLRSLTGKLTNICDVILISLSTYNQTENYKTFEFSIHFNL